MIKIILTIAQLLSAESQIETNRQWNEAITNVQEQKTWIKEDIVNGRISEKWFYTHIKSNSGKLPRIDMLNILSEYCFRT